jgi:hypothetical protein
MTRSRSPQGDRFRQSRLLTGVLALTLAGCAVSPYDFPMPTMIGNEQGVSMTGFMATASEDEVRRRLSKRMACPHGTDFAALETRRADNRMGTKILHYRAVLKCRTS